MKPLRFSVVTPFVLAGAARAQDVDNLRMQVERWTKQGSHRLPAPSTRTSD